MSVLCFGASVQGNSHVNRGIPCQDAHLFYTMPNGWTVAAVADGVGSAKCSEKGSKIAVNAAVGFCVKNFPITTGDCSAENYDKMMKSMILMAFNRALMEVAKEAEKDQKNIVEYDTTLVLVVYNGVKLYYGHVGDSGLFGLTVSGEYQAITTQQKGEDGRSVIPLRFGVDYWEIKGLSEEYAALLLVTDGILENLIMPGLLKMQKEHLYIYRMRSLMDRTYKESFAYDISKNNVGEIQEMLTEQLKIGCYKNVTDDDKTIVVLISMIRTPEKKEASYYEKPDEEELKRRQERLLYGASYNKEEKKPKQEKKKSVENKEEENKSETPKVKQSVVTPTNISRQIQLEGPGVNKIYTREECNRLVELMMEEGDPLIEKSILQKFGEHFKRIF